MVGGIYEINGQPFTVIGVAPPGFFGAKIDRDSGMPDFWLPLTTEPLIVGATSRLENPRPAWLDVIGRVRTARIRKFSRRNSRSSCTSGWRAIRRT